jgi:hypothetical protein
MTIVCSAGISKVHTRAAADATAIGATDHRRFSRIIIARSMALEVLYCALVLLRSRAGLEGAEIAAPAGLRIDLARIEAIAARFELSDHCRFQLLSLALVVPPALLACTT